MIKQDDVHDSGRSAHQRNLNSLMIRRITEKVLSDDDCWEFQCYIEECGYTVDMVNTEYLGFLTFSIQNDYSLEKLVEIVNKFFEKYGVAKAQVHRQGESSKRNRHV